MKYTLGTVFLVIALGLTTVLIVDAVQSNYKYDNQILNYWTLADRASTIEQKSQYIDQFVSALENSGLQGTYDAIWLYTPTNSFDSNLQALQSLQSRLKTIQTMDENSFQYQTAIQQITAQEQGQADDMLAVFQDCWQKVNYYWLWNGWLSLLWILAIIGAIVGSVISFNWDSDVY